MAEGWIKLYRKVIDWEWFTYPSVAHMFLYLLIKASSDDKKWQGKAIKRGQLITSVSSISEGTGLSEKTVRRSLDKLIRSGELKRETTNKYSLITICNYDKYQIRTFDQSNDHTNDQSNDQHLKNIKKVRKKELSSSPSSARKEDSEKTFYNDLKGSVEMMTRLEQDFGLSPDRYWSLLASYDRECIAKGVQHTSMTDYKTRFCDWVRAHVSKGPDDYKQQMLSDTSWSETMCMKYKITPQKLKDTIEEFFVDQQCRGHQSHENLQDAKSHFNSWLMIKLNKENNNGNKQLTPKDRFLKEFEQQQREEYQRMGFDLSKMQQASAGTDVF